MTTEERAAAVFGACRERHERGETVDLEEVFRAHPDLEARLRPKFAALRLVERAYAREHPVVDTEALPSLAGRVLGPYRLLSVLGTGGMGTVYLASVEGRAPALQPGDRVAVKVVHPHLLARRGFFKRFLREAEIGQRLRHENVVRTLDADEVVDEGAHVHFFVMEYVEGRTLRSLLDELSRVPEELCRHVGREVAKALAAIHAAGAVHRDLKPENVLITRDHVVKVMDLGVARLQDEQMRLSQTGAFVGSVRYAAPEQFKGGGEAVDGRADLYALGLTLYELATGMHPFADDDFHVVLRRQVSEAPRPAGEVNPQLSPFFEDLLRRLLEKDRDARWPSADALHEALVEGERCAWWQERAKAIRAATRRPLRRIRIPRETALYGRDADLATLRKAFDRAKAGDGNVLLVEGEAGIGKTRLVDEFVGMLRRDGEDVNFLFGGNPPGGAATASGAFTTAYREQFGDEGLEATLAAYLTPTPILVPAFAALLRGEPSPEGKEPLTKDSLQTVFVHATRALAAERPTIVLIDDLHFAPEEGRSLFAALTLAVPGHRVLLVGTARPELPEPWVTALARHDHVRRMALPRLGPKDLARLLVDAFHSERLAEDLAFKIGAKSDGNPYFVFEIIRGLRDGQFIAQKPDGTWVTTQIIREVEVPSTIKDLIFARIGNLPTEERNLLDVAACHGFEFDPVLVGEVVGLAPIPSLQRLAGIEKSHRLVRSAGRRFLFDHHQVAEVLYAALPELLREHYHASIAVAMEARSGAASKDPKDLDGALCVDLAEHFLKGAQGSRALRYLDGALTHMERGYLYDAAACLAARALAVPGFVEGSLRADLLVGQGNRLWRYLRRPEEGLAVANEARDLACLAGDLRAESRAATLLGHCLRQLGRLAEAQAPFERSLDLVREIRDPLGECKALAGLGILFLSLGNLLEAREHVARGRALARDLGERREEATANGILGGIFKEMGRHAEAQEYIEAHLAIARELGDLRIECVSSVNLGSLLIVRGRFAEAQLHLGRASGLARQTGSRFEEVIVGNLGLVFESLGHYGEARRNYERSMAQAREIGDRTHEALMRYNLGNLSLAMGDFSGAKDALDASLAVLRATGNQGGEAVCLHALGELAAALREPDVADRLLHEALALQRRMGPQSDIVWTLLALGRRAAECRLESRARDFLAEASDLAGALDAPGGTTLAACRLARLPGGDGGAACEAFAVHEPRLRADMRLEARFLLWQITHDRLHLDEAAHLLEDLVAHAPADCRESILTNVPLHREVAAAVRAAGLSNDPPLA